MVSAEFFTDMWDYSIPGTKITQKFPKLREHAKEAIEGLVETAADAPIAEFITLFSFGLGEV